MAEQFGLIYWINPTYIATPNTDEGLRIYRSTVDNLYYVKKSDGTSELFSAGLSPANSQFRGGWDASLNTFPATGGSGAAGAIIAGDSWVITVAGVLCGEDVIQGDVIIALVDAPAQVCGNWTVIENNIGYVPENVANKATDFTVINNTLYPSVQAVENRISGTPGQVVFYAASGLDGDAGFTWDNALQILGVGIAGGSATIRVNGGSGFGSTLSIRQDTVIGMALDVYNQNFSRFYLRAGQDGAGAGTTASVDVMGIVGLGSAATFYDVDGVLRIGFGGHFSGDNALLNSRNDMSSIGSDALFSWTNTLSVIEINSEKGLGYANPFIYMTTNEGAGVTGAIRLASKGDSYIIGDSNRFGFGLSVPTARVHIRGIGGANVLVIDSDAAATLLKITNAGIISIPTVQIGNAGLVAGDLYVDSEANITANGDVFVGRKV